MKEPSETTRMVRIGGDRSHIAESTLPNGVWLSLVERCVRDAEVVSSNLATPIPFQPYSIHLAHHGLLRLGVKRFASQATLGSEMKG